ncbi:MAG: mechanosensitive ion channel family protein [Sulfurifustaceae bacterium]
MSASFLDQLIEHLQYLVVHVGPRVVAAALIFSVFWFIAGFSDRASARLLGYARLNVLVASLLSRAIRFGLVFLGIVTAAGTLGVNISALVAGLGLTGFAVGFALRDTISNVLAGVLLLVYRPFDINDRINVTSQEGIVVSIDLRYTTLDSDSTRILIPNSVLFTNPIIVVKRRGTPI